MNLTETPSIVTWPVIDYVYVEKVGPFQETAPEAWQELRKGVAEISTKNEILGYLSLYKMEPKMVYRAGVSVNDKPVTLPKGFHHVRFEGGKYAKFTLVGPYSNLPEACGRVFEIVSKKKMPVRDDFFIENYANDPKVTPEDKLVTEILIPMT